METKNIAVAYDTHTIPKLGMGWAGAICYLNGVVEETGLGAGVLDDPVMGVVWLANRLQQLGIPLVAGETILGDSSTRPIDCRSGGQFVVDFGDLGTIELSVN